jgi:hypothetical protein
MEISYPFVKGLTLSERLYVEGVQPVLAEHFPGLPYSAARLMPGSDTLGYDTPRSMDHFWGTILEIYLSGEDYDRYAGEIHQAMRRHLPREVGGVPTNFSSADHSHSRPQYREEGDIEHRVLCVNVDAFIISHRAFNPVREPVTPLDWLTFPQQNLRLIRSGRVFHDGLRELEPIRRALHYYPDDIWYYLLSAQWERFGQESQFMGRCGEVGDELGARVLAARLIHYMMDLCFLMARQYAPYSKWFGTAFAELPGAAQLSPLFQGALDAKTWQEREQHLSPAYEYLAEMHNTLGITEPVAAKVGKYYGRPYLVLGEANPCDKIYAKITDPDVRRLPKYLGSIDQITNLVCVRDDPAYRAKFVALYAPEKS